MVFPGVTFHWLAVAVEIMQSMAAASSRRFRHSQSNTFYRDLYNFSTATVHKTKIRRKYIFSGAYFSFAGPDHVLLNPLRPNSDLSQTLSVGEVMRIEHDHSS